MEKKSSIIIIVICSCLSIHTYRHTYVGLLTSTYASQFLDIYLPNTLIKCLYQCTYLQKVTLKTTYLYLANKLSTLKSIYLYNLYEVLSKCLENFNMTNFPECLGRNFKNNLTRLWIPIQKLVMWTTKYIMKPFGKKVVDVCKASERFVDTWKIR